VVEIFSIDVSSELETLCEAQLRGTWQVPAELVRMALRLGASDVSVGKNGSWFVVDWDGPVFDGDVLPNLRTAFDGECGPDLRQQAITMIEQSGMEALLWAGGLRGAAVEIERVVSGRRESLRHHRRNRPRFERGAAGEGISSVTIRWRCAGLDQRRASRWLAAATRFAQATILVNGKAVRKGFSGGLYHVRLDQPVPCRIGLTRDGDDPVLWLLHDGVISARAGVPGYPAFEAAVELGGCVAPGASAADLRRAVTPFLGELVDRAVWLMVETSGKLPEMSGSRRDRLGLLLLRAAHRGMSRNEIRKIPLVKCADGDRLVSLEDLREMAGRRSGVLAAIEPKEFAGCSLVDPRFTVVASSEVRSLITMLTGVRFQSPSRRVRSLTRRFKERLRSWSEAMWPRIRGLVAPRPLRAPDLRPEEAELLATIRSALNPVRVELCEGEGPPVWTAGSLVVPRSNPALEAAARLLPQDPSWLYPLLLSLKTTTGVPGDLRHEWLRAVGIIDPDHVM
jgi:hypothetical protein